MFRVQFNNNNNNNNKRMYRINKSHFINQKKDKKKPHSLDSYFDICEQKYYKQNPPTYNISVKFLTVANKLPIQNYVFNVFIMPQH